MEKKLNEIHVLTSWNLVGDIIRLGALGIGYKLEVG